MAKISIIGNGAAGIRAAETIRSYNQEVPIEIFTEETLPHYSPVFLANVVSGSADEEGLKPLQEDFYEKYEIDGPFRFRVSSVHPDSKTLSIQGKDGVKEVEYSKLLIATGASPFIPPIKGTDSNGVYKFSRLGDVRNVLSWIRNRDVESCIVVGAGFIGLEVAEALAELGLETKILELLDRILPQLLDESCSEVVREKVEDKGVEVHLETALEEINGDPVESVRADSEDIECELVILATGVKPNMELVEDSGIEVGEGIIVDENMKTSEEEIYAAGDVAEAFNVFGERSVCPTWSSAVRQGKVAGANMVGEDLDYQGDLRNNHVDVFGSRIVSVGRTLAEEGIERFEIIREEDDDSIRIGIFDSDRLVGFTGIGCREAIEKSGAISTLIRKEIEIEDKEGILRKGFSYKNVLKEAGIAIPR